MSLRQEDEPLECLEGTLRGGGRGSFHLTSQSCLWNPGHGSLNHLVCHLPLHLLVDKLMITGYSPDPGKGRHHRTALYMPITNPKYSLLISLTLRILSGEVLANETLKGAYPEGVWNSFAFLIKWIRGSWLRPLPFSFVLVVWVSVCGCVCMALCIWLCVSWLCRAKGRTK